MRLSFVFLDYLMRTNVVVVVVVVVVVAVAVVVEAVV